MGRVLRDDVRQFGEATFRITLELTTRMPPVEQVSTALCFAFDGDRVVLAKHVDRGWVIPGGHLEVDVRFAGVRGGGHRVIMARSGAGSLHVVARLRARRR